MWFLKATSSPTGPRLDSAAWRPITSHATRVITICKSVTVSTSLTTSHEGRAVPKKKPEERSRRFLCGAPTPRSCHRTVPRETGFNRSSPRGRICSSLMPFKLFPRPDVHASKETAPGGRRFSAGSWGQVRTSAARPLGSERRSESTLSGRTVMPRLTEAPLVIQGAVSRERRLCHLGDSRKGEGCRKT